eukprot:85641_1
MEGENVPMSPRNVQLREFEDPQNNIPDGKWRDAPFAIAYYISLLFSLILGIYLLTQTNAQNDPSISFQFDLLQVSIGVLTAIVFTFIWLVIVILFSECIIKSSLILTPIVLLCFAIASFLTSPVFGVILLIIAGLSAWYAYSVWNRVEFAVACLKIVIQVFKSYYTPLFINLLMSFVSIILLMIDCMVFVGVLNGVSSSGVQAFLMFLLFFLIYWHNIVSINVAHVTACGVMGTWFYTDTVDGITKHSFTRAVTTSFGSICFGALIEAVIRALSAIVRHLQQQNRENMAVVVLLCMVRCILDCIGDIVEYINSYAFVYVALYGEPYLVSAKNVWAMFKSRGIEALVNDDLTSIPLWLGAILNLIVIILVCGVIGGFNENLIIAAVFGLVIYMCCVQTIISYVKTLFVCWLNDPATFCSRRPQEFEQIVDAANKFGYNTQWCQPINNGQQYKL